MDALGNIYVADSGNHAVKEILAVNGIIPPSPTIVTLAANYCSPDGASFDSQGNLYFSDYCNAAVYEILAVNGSMPASPVVRTISSGAGLNGVTDVTVDQNENIYVGGAFSGTQIPQVYPSDIGSVPVGTTADATPLMFTFMNSITLGSVSVTTLGTGGLDFSDAGTGTCTAGNPYSVYQLCTVDVTFSPKLAGTRFGAVLLKDTSGNVLATGYVHGKGVAPVVNFAPPVQTTTVSNVSQVSGIAVDASGNLYIAATGQSQILKETPSGASYIQSVVPTSSLNAPRGVAVDNAGNIYIADTGNNRVLKETPSTTGFKETTVDNVQAPVGVAVDEDGHIDIVYTSGIFTAFRTDGYLGTGLSSASGVAVDTSDNLYIASTSAPGSILKETLSGSNYVSSTILLPTSFVPSGVTVDPFGNLYVSYTDNGIGRVIKLTPSASGYIQSTIPTEGLSQPAGLAVDASGNVFIADSGNGRVVKGDCSDPPSLAFASTNVGASSSDSPQSVTVTNIGNADLMFPIPPTGNNPSIASNFFLASSEPSACPVIGSGFVAPGTLAAGNSCELSVSFEPTVAGNLNGSLVLTDNNLNTPAPDYASQTITLAGTGTPATPTITWAAPAPISYGTSLNSTQLNATASVPGAFVYTPSSGTVLSAGPQTLSVTFTPTDTADYTTTTASVPLTVNPSITTSTCGQSLQTGVDSGDALWQLGTPCKTGTNSGGYTVSSISYWVGSPTSTSFDLGVYSDSSGSPSSLLCSVSTGTITPSPGWNSINISSCPTLSANTTYWVGYLTGSNAIEQGTVGGACPERPTTALGPTPHYPESLWQIRFRRMPKAVLPTPSI